MNTPIVDFVRNYADSGVSRLHMPGHKGKRALGCEHLDITEIDGADVLYAADGIIDESERNASALFGSAHTYFSTEGSSLCIKAMLAMVTAGKHCQTIVAARNVHKSFIYAAALLDLDVVWLTPATPHLCRCDVTADDVLRALENCQAAAVYLTSPDYLGNTADIAGIAAVCREKNVPLLVDNAHGAYLRFTDPPSHPISLGAAICCDSAHKTLPVLTGGAYLHVSEEYTEYCQAARRSLALFASTSPSYLILQSLDLCSRYLADDYSERLNRTVERLNGVKKSAAVRGICVAETEPLKLVIDAAASGWSGYALADVLRDHACEPEFADDDYLVCMLTPENDERDYVRLEQALSLIDARTPIVRERFDFTVADRAMSIRSAIFSPHETISAEDAVGRICASPSVSCPPAVPIVISGERITENAVRAFRHYGIDKVDVVSTN